MWPAPRKQAVQGSLFYVLNTYRVRPGQRPKIFCIISRTSQKQLKNESKQQGETFPLDTCSNHFIAHDCNRNYSLNWIEIEKLSSLYLNAVRNKFVFFLVCLCLFFKIILRIDPDATFIQAEMKFATVLKGPLLITSHFKIIIFAFEISLKLKLNGVLKIDFLVRLKTINWASSEASSEKSRKDIHFMSQLVEPKSRNQNDWSCGQVTSNRTDFSFAALEYQVCF